MAALVVDILKQFHDVFGADLWESELWEARSGSIALMTPGVVIIDEIDAHLHISWQRRIGPWLTAHFPRIQFIVTTHSPYICQAADPGGLIRLPGVDEARPPEVIDQDLYDRVVYGSGDDAVLSDLFGLAMAVTVAELGGRGSRLRRRGRGTRRETQPGASRGGPDRHGGTGPLHRTGCRGHGPEPLRGVTFCPRRDTFRPHRCPGSST
ncbi:AAA family ATPase [Streptomyces bobili]